MIPLLMRCRTLVLAGCLAVLPLAGWAASEPSGLSADEVMQKALERVDSPARRGLQPKYFYTKHTLKEDMDLRGHIKDRKEKLYEVSVDAGFSYLKLLQFNGQNLSAAESKKQEDREVAERQKMLDAKPGKRDNDWESFLTAELLQKYNYSLLEVRLLNGRQAYVIAFEPKNDLGVKNLTDRFANQMAGTVWIDAEDFELARAEIHLKGEVTLWGGMVGALKYGRFTLERTRLPDGVWFDSLSHGMFEGRKLLEPMIIRTRSESSNFRRQQIALQ